MIFFDYPFMHPQRAWERWDQRAMKEYLDTSIYPFFRRG
jgi:hypothetical protein